MSFKAAKFLVIGAGFSLAASIALAQEVVHAVAGMVTRIDPAAQTITVKTNDGSTLVLQEASKKHVDVDYDFDKALQAEATDSAAFNKQGDRAVVFYFEEGSQQRAVGIEDLGPTPLKVASGEITHFDHHHHQLTIKAADGSKQTFQLDNKTVVETPMGVVDGDRFEGQNGDQISIRYQDKGGNNEAVFMSES